MAKLDKGDIWRQPADPSKSVLSNLPRTTKELKARLKKAQKEDETYNKNLQKRARNLEQLTVGLECLVVESQYHQESTYFAPRSEIVLDGRSPRYSGGHLYRVELVVESDSSLQKLLFNGWPHLEAGDMIKAYIFKGKKEYEHGHRLIVPDNLEELPDFHRKIFKNIPFHWVERAYQSVEQPSKIEKLRDGKVVATYHNS